MESTDIVDQRKHRRFPMKEGGFAVLMNHVIRVGPIKDISQGGLAFTYISEDKLPQGSFMVNLLFGDDKGFYLKNIPSKIITAPFFFIFSHNVGITRWG
jgi:hypothetical protein